MKKGLLFSAILVLFAACKPMNEDKKSSPSNAPAAQSPAPGQPQPGQTPNPNTPGTNNPGTPNPGTNPGTTTTDTGCNGKAASLTCSGSNLTVCVASGTSQANQAMTVDSCPPSSLSIACVNTGSGQGLKITYTSGGSSSTTTSSNFASAEACEAARQQLQSDYDSL